jgi:hypothetical protein
MLGVSVATVRRWRLPKQGPRFLKLGALCKYRVEDISALSALKVRNSSMTVGEPKTMLAVIPDDVDVTGIAYTESTGGWMLNVDTIRRHTVAVAGSTTASSSPAAVEAQPGTDGKTEPPRGRGKSARRDPLLRAGNFPKKRFSPRSTSPLGNYLVSLTTAERALQAAQTPPEIRQIIDLAGAAKEYAKAASLGWVGSYLRREDQASGAAQGRRVAEPIGERQSREGPKILRSLRTISLPIARLWKKRRSAGTRPRPGSRWPRSRKRSSPRTSKPTKRRARS